MDKKNIELRQTLLEFGDFENIELYPYQNNQFITDFEGNVNVKFQPIDKSLIKNLGISKFKLSYPLNCMYNIDGVNTQYIKTDYKEFIKILKTVFNIINNFLESHPEVDGLLFMGANRDSKKVNDQTDSAKTKIYRMLVYKHSSPKDWIIADLEGPLLSNTYEAFMLIKKKRYNRLQELAGIK